MSLVNAAISAVVGATIAVILAGAVIGGIIAMLRYRPPVDHEPLEMDGEIGPDWRTHARPELLD